MEITIEYQPILEAPAASGVKPIKNNLIMQNKPNFQIAQMNINLYSVRPYRNETPHRHPQNKPNQTQFKPNLKSRHPYCSAEHCSFIQGLPQEKLVALRQCIEKIRVNKPAGEIKLAIYQVPAGNLQDTVEVKDFRLKCLRF